MKRFPLYKQLDSMDCGPTCLRMVSAFYGKRYSLDTIRKRSAMSRTGSSLLGLSEAAESLGFQTTGVKLTLEQLLQHAPLPCIIHWRQRHFVVCYDVRKTRKGYRVYVADPAAGLLVYNETELMKAWMGTSPQGIALLLRPGPRFDATADEEPLTSNKGLKALIRYFNPYRKYLTQVLIGLFVISILQLIFPFLTQSLVDIGIAEGNLNFIRLVLIAQVVLFVARLSVEFIRSWILLHVNTRVTISLIADFLIKIMKLPLRFFDTKSIGDLLQRIGDHKRIESFLTGNAINLVFSFINFFIFAIVLAFYKWSILALFLVGNGLYVAYVLMFMKQRRALDHKRFAQASEEQGNLIQLITGMPDIKLANCEQQKRWQWEQIQVRLFHISLKGLTIGQLQQAGSVFFSQMTNIVITFLAAQAVVSGEITLGMMMAITYIIGQLSAPIDQFIGFAQSYQDATISLERLNEVHGKDDEETQAPYRLNVLPADLGLVVENVSFSYDGADRNYVLSDVTLRIPAGKTIAIVGASGSGKTTLVKLLMGFYTPNKGTIRLGGTPLEMINPHVWRDAMGSVLQDGFLFSDTIAGNIALGDETIDSKRLQTAAFVANLMEVIETLPLGFATKIGMDGQGLSQGQKQRILIARAVYKNPSILFFDEATNALDATNEHIIQQRLSDFLVNRTAIVVAHRLSTVKDADHIVVLDKGRIVEEGDHQALIARKGYYYELVRNQLELGQ